MSETVADLATRALNMSWSDYAELDLNTKLEMGRAVGALADETVFEAFQNPDVQWIVISGGPTNVVHEEIESTFPNPEVLDKIGEEIGTALFVFTRPIELSPEFLA